MSTRLVALIFLLLGGAAAHAGEDCYNSEQQWKMTGTQPENLRVTDADIDSMRESMAAHEAAVEAAAAAERDAAEAAAKATASTAPTKEGG